MQLIMYVYVYRLGQACNHVAALLFFIEHHAGKEELPSDLSKTSKPMTWNQPPKKEINPARAEDMVFVKPTHSDVNRIDNAHSIQRSQFDPRHPADRTLQKNAMNKLLNRVQLSMPGTGLQQFWQTRSCEVPSSSNHFLRLWDHVLFWPENASTVSCENFYPATSVQCYEYLSTLHLSHDEVKNIELATRGQADNNLWYALRNGRLTCSKFGEIMHRHESTNPRRLVKDIMGYGRQM